MTSMPIIMITFGILNILYPPVYIFVKIVKTHGFDFLEDDPDDGDLISFLITNMPFHYLEIFRFMVISGGLFLLAGVFNL